MTMIARISVDGIVLYIGDMLLSSGRPAERIVDIPTQDDVNTKLGETDWSVVGLHQKLSIFDGKLCIAWAGKLFQARPIIRELVELYRTGSRGQELFDHIQSLPPSDRDQVSLIVDVFETTAETSRFAQINIGDTISRSFGEIEVTAAGSGSESFLKTFDYFVPYLSALRGQVHPKIWARLAGVYMQASLVGGERVWGGGLTEAWGGAFEIATLALDRNEFEKIGDILHVIWIAEKKEDGLYDFVMPPDFLKYDYFKDCFVSHRFKIIDSGQGGTADDQVRVWTPILSRRVDFDLTQVKIDTTFTYLAVFVFAQPNSFVKIFPADKGSEDAPFKLTRSAPPGKGGRAKFEFRMDVTDWFRLLGEKLTGEPVEIDLGDWTPAPKV